MKKIKILYVNHATALGGATRSLINLISDLDKNKYDIKILFFNKPDYSSYLDDNNIDYEVTSSSFYLNYYKYFPNTEASYIRFYQLFRLVKHSLFWLLSRYYFSNAELKKFDYDIIHFNSSVFTDWLSSAKRRGKVVIHIREPFRKGSFGLLYRIFRFQIIKYTDNVIAISNDNKQRLNINNSNVVYNHSKIPLNISIEPIRSRNNVLYLGGISEIKGFYTLVEALDYLNDDVKIHFAGHLPLFDIKRNSSKNKLKYIIKLILKKNRRRNKAYKKIVNHRNVVVLGFINDVSKYLNESCCLISPFTVSHFSRPIIEAHLHKRPVIGTNVEGMSEIISNNYNGIIIEKNNPKELASAINYLTSNKEIAVRYGQNGYNDAINKFTASNVNTVNNIYLNLMKHT